MPTDEPHMLTITQDAVTGRAIVQTPNGDELPGVARVAVYLDNDTGTAEAHITVRGVALDVLCPTHARPAPRGVPLLLSDAQIAEHLAATASRLAGGEG